MGTPRTREPQLVGHHMVTEVTCLHWTPLRAEWIRPRLESFFADSSMRFNRL